MRLDKYLKVSRLIKRRTVANEACDAGRVSVNGKPAKASVNVKVGDEVTPNTDADGLVTITAAFPEDVESKVAFSESSEGLDLTWDKDDYLTIVGKTTEKYTIVTFDGKVATFKGNPVKGTSFDVILSRSDDYASRTYTDQTQTTVASKDKLLYDGELPYINNELNTRTFPFVKQIVKMNKI